MVGHERHHRSGGRHDHLLLALRLLQVPHLAGVAETGSHELQEAVVQALLRSHAVVRVVVGLVTRHVGFAHRASDTALLHDFASDKLPWRFGISSSSRLQFLSALGMQRVLRLTVTICAVPFFLLLLDHDFNLLGRFLTLLCQIAVAPETFRVTAEGVWLTCDYSCSRLFIFIILKR